MHKIAWIICFYLFLIGVSAIDVDADEPAAGKQVEQKFEYKKNPRHNMGYLLYLPENYGKTSEKHPLILFLHGSGERGNKLAQLKKHGPPKIVDERANLPFIVVSPQLSLDNSRFDPAAVAALLDSIEEKYQIDQDRIYLTGLSMGGGGAWQLAAHQPERFAAVVPICGYTDARDGAKIKTPAIWVVHGDADFAVPYPESEHMVDALRKAGSDVKFTIHRGGPHDTWTSMYGMPEFYDWLLRHSRRATK